MSEPVSAARREDFHPYTLEPRPIEHLQAEWAEHRATIPDEAKPVLDDWEAEPVVIVSGGCRLPFLRLPTDGQ